MEGCLYGMMKTLVVGLDNEYIAQGIGFIVYMVNKLHKRGVLVILPSGGACECIGGAVGAA